MCLGIESAWCIVFVCRLWWCYLQKMSTSRTSENSKIMSDTKKNINSYFITRPAYLSAELNAHNLLYLVLLVKQKHLPQQALQNIHLFNSQACESIFRDARSLSGTFSTKINFTVKDFLRRSQQLMILNQLKHNQSDKKISFPVHHKHAREQLSFSSYQVDEIDTLDIEQIILDAFQRAIMLVKHSKMYYKLNEYNINSLYDLSQYIYDVLNKNSRMINYSLPPSNSSTDEFGLDEDNDDSYDMNTAENISTDEVMLDYLDDPISDDDVLRTEKKDFNGLRLVDRISPSLRYSYFKIKVNGNVKYLHKQSACWLLSNNTTKLSNDRLSRVQQQTIDY